MKSYPRHSQEIVAAFLSGNSTFWNMEFCRVFLLVVCIFLGPSTPLLSANDKDDVKEHRRYQRNAGQDISDSAQIFESTR